jgi:hypothetical protein
VFDRLHLETIRPLRGGNRCEEIMRTHMSALGVIVLFGFCNQADAEAQCPELSRLRSEAAQAAKQMTGLPRPKGCETYIRSSNAWHAIVQFANDHREACDISSISLSEFEQRHREAVSARDNVCAGRPVRAFPAEIIHR